MRRPANPETKPTPTDTLLYLRVSSKKQLKEGDGLASQRRRLEMYAQGKGHPVVQVFSDSLTGSEQRRPGLQALLAFLRSNPQRRFRVLFDHLDRWVRDTNLAHELPHAVPLLAHLRGIPKWVLADRRYTSHAFRQHSGTSALCPPSRRFATKRQVACPDWIYNNRNRVERLWARLKEWRALATRYERTAASFLGVLCLAAAFDWIRR